MIGRKMILEGYPIDKYVPDFVNIHIDKIKKYLEEASA